MSETVFVTMEEQSRKCPRPEMTKIESTPRRSTKQWQNHNVIHHDVLHKVHHTGITTSQHKTRDHVTWHKHSGKTLPHNLFFEGFNDCASEVIRFLTEVEKVEDNNPLVQGLQTHLVNVSRAICQESIKDLEQNDDVPRGNELRLSCRLNTKSAGSLPDADCTVHDELMVDCSRSAQHLPCALSPIVMRSSNTSVSDMSYSESDMSTSCSSNVACQSISSEPSTSLNNSSAELNPDSSVDYSKNDDVFRCLSPQIMFRSDPADPTVPKLNKNRVLSLQQLASMAVPKVTVTIDKNNSEILTETELCLPTSERAGYKNEDDIIQNSMRYLLPLGQSSPVLTRSQSHSSTRSQSHSSPTNRFFSHGQNANVSSPSCLLLERSSPTALQTQTFSELTPISNRAFLASSHVPSLAERIEVQTGLECHPRPLQLTTDISQYMGSIQDPQTSFLPGIDISSVDSGSFADILLAVESCRFHEEPQVRALANELLHLIQDEYSDNTDDDTDDEDHEDETNRNDESGIELMDESSDWGNPADMIEQ